MPDHQHAPTPLIGTAKLQEMLETGTRYLVRELPEGEMYAHFSVPADFDPTRARLPAVVFLHGGLWDLSMPVQFLPHCHHFASRGVIAITAEYRCRDKFGGGPLEAIEDVKEVMVWLRRYAEHFGIDPERITLAGAASGGHAALCTTLDSPEDGGISARPNALVLFGPVSNTSPRGGLFSDHFPSPRSARAASPVRRLPQKHLPPCLVLHGTQNRVVPYDQSVKLVKLYKKRRNHCELMEFTGQGHTFFNYNTGDQNYEITLRAVDHFLVTQGLMEADPYANLVQ